MEQLPLFPLFARNRLEFILGERTDAMGDNITDTDQTENDIRAYYEISDETLEAAAATVAKMAIGTGNVQPVTAGFCGC